MEALRLEGTTNTPKIDLIPSENKLEFSGESRPENVQAFYTPILEWIREYEKHLHYLIEFHLEWRRGTVRHIE